MKIRQIFFQITKRGNFLSTDEDIVNMFHTFRLLCIFSNLSVCVCFFVYLFFPVFARVFVDLANLWALIQMNDVNTLLNTDYDPVLEARSAYVITNCSDEFHVCE